MEKIQWLMMGAFIVGLGLAVYKLYLFFPKTRLKDDDTTPESVALLEKILVETDNNYPHLTHEALYAQMRQHREFDPQHFWRFNENRLYHLIDHYRFKESTFRR